ncbi:MAG: site-specific integrase [Lentisphaerae bacterium]|nr:site-specific integrase [Lentisphaerota bacterium]
MKTNSKATIKSDDYEVHYGFRIRLQNTKAGKRYQVDLGRKSGRHVRKSFPTLQEARNWAHRMSIEADNKGIAALRFSEEQKTDAVEALDTLKEFGVNLRTAAAFFAKHHKKVDRTNGFGALIEQYLKEQQARTNKGELRPSTFNDMQGRLKPFQANLGHMAIDAIEARDIDQLMNEMSFTGTNRQNYKRYLSGFFNWAVRQKKTGSNPVTETETVKVESHTPEIYTPSQVKALFSACYKEEKPRSELIPFFAIAFFAGVRPEEIMRLEWKDIDLSLGEIHIRAGHSKTRQARIVHLSDNLKKWLLQCPQKEGSIFPYSETSLKRWRKEVHQKAGVEVIHDGARHTFATFYLALHGLDDTLQELGHTDPKMLFKHYRGLAKNRKAQAQKFFEIAPATGEKVLKIEKQGAA